MISCCSLSGEFSPEMLCFLLSLLPFGEITMLLKILSEKKKRYCVLFSRVIAESDFRFVF